MKKIVNNKISRYLFIIIIIIIFCILTIKYIKYERKTNDNGDINDTNECTKTYSLKGFTYVFPCEYAISTDDKNSFNLNNNNWHARIEPFIDRNGEIVTYMDIAYDIRIKHGNQVNKPYYKQFNGKSSIIFEDLDDYSVICYYKVNDIFDYEITLYNSDKTFDIDALNYIVSILDEATYEENNQYMYDVLDLKSVADKQQ